MSARNIPALAALVFLAPFASAVAQEANNEGGSRGEVSFTDDSFFESASASDVSFAFRASTTFFSCSMRETFSAVALIASPRGTS